MPTDADDAGLSDVGDASAAATDEAGAPVDDTAPDPAWVARETEIREEERQAALRDRANLQQIKDRETAAEGIKRQQAEGAAHVFGLENEALRQQIRAWAEAGMIPEAEAYKFELHINNARSKATAQLQQQFAQQQQQQVSTQQVDAQIVARQLERATELSYGDAGLRQLRALPAFQAAVNAHRQLAHLCAQNPTPANQYARDAAGASIRAIEEQFAASFKAQPALKQSSNNLKKGADRGPQSTTSRAGGSGAAAYDGLAVSAKAWELFPNDYEKRAEYLATQKANAAPTRR